MAATDFGDGFSFAGISADVGPYNILGGRYAFAASATWGGGSATIQVLMPDASTYVSVAAAVTADGAQLVDLPPGRYKIAVATATGLMGFLLRVPYRAA